MLSEQPIHEPVSAGLEYAAGPDGAIVTGCARHLTELVIPAEHSGLPVTRIAPGAFRGHPHLLAVTLPDSLAIVGEEAFMDCHALMTVRGGAGLKRLGTRAFYQCVALRKLDFPAIPDADVTAFAGCYQLEAANEQASYR